MKHYHISGLPIVAILAAFWAYAIMDSLIREFLRDVTYIDLGAIFMLGLISGWLLQGPLRSGEDNPMSDRLAVQIAYVAQESG